MVEEGEPLDLAAVRDVGIRYRQVFVVPREYMAKFRDIYTDGGNVNRTRFCSFKLVRPDVAVDVTKIFWGFANNLKILNGLIWQLLLQG